MEDRLQKLTEDVKASLDAYLAEKATQETIEATQKAAESESGTFEVVITTENLDRYEEVISLDGWQLDHYMNNPVVLWGHDHKQLPVGIATSVDIVDGKMVAKGKFATHPFAQTIRQLYDAGVLRATSVGFIEKEREGNLITKAELLEFSFVSVPANPYALSLMVKDGVSVNEMVTKGILTIEEEEEPAPAPAPEEGDTPADEPLEPPTEAGEPQEPQEPGEPEERSFQLNAFAIETAKKSLTEALIALEALSETGEEPEGNEVPEDDADEKALREFSEKRRKVQEASTILSEVLAEARQAVEARRAS